MPTSWCSFGWLRHAQAEPRCARCAPPGMDPLRMWRYQARLVGYTGGGREMTFTFAGPEPGEQCSSTRNLCGLSEMETFAGRTVEEGITHKDVSKGTSEPCCTPLCGSRKLLMKGESLLPGNPYATESAGIIQTAIPPLPCIHAFPGAGGGVPRGAAPPNISPEKREWVGWVARPLPLSGSP